MSGADSLFNEAAVDGGGADTVASATFDGGSAARVTVYGAPADPPVPGTVDGGGADTVAAYRMDGGGAGTTGALTVDAGYGSLAPAVTQHTGTAAPRVPRMTFQGDPRLVMGPDGTRLLFTGGQPLMDAGLENLALISLFTNKGWCGNGFMRTPIGSDFMSACNQPITRQALNEIRTAAEAALLDPALGRVSVTVMNPTGYQVRVGVRIEPPAGNPQELTLTKNGENWRTQADHPAYLEI